MHTSHLPIVAFLLFILAFPFGGLQAQTPTLTVNQGDTSCGAATVGLCITVENFDMIGGIEHVLIWDPTILNLSTSGVQIHPSIDMDDDFLVSSDSTFNFGWSNSTPRNFMDGDTLYCLVFDVVGTIPAGGTLIDQWPVANRPVSFVGPPNQVTVDIFPTTTYTFNSIFLTPTSGSSADVTAPTVSGCPTDITVTAPVGGSTIVNWTPPTGTDVCGVTSSSTHNSGDSFMAGTTTTVTYTFTDPSGNATPCTFNVIVEEDMTGGGTSEPSLTLYQTDTNCTDDIVTVCMQGDSLFDLAVYSHLLVFEPSVLEFIGLSSSTPSMTMPAVTTSPLPDSVIFLNFGTTGGDPANPMFPTVDGDDLYCLDFRIIGDISSGSIIRRYEESERGPAPPDQIQIGGAGGPILNENQYLFNSPLVVMQTSGTGLDTQAPVVSGCPSDITLTVPAGTSNATASWIPPTATDDCGGVTSTSTHNPGDSFPLGTTTVTYTFTDGAGNSVPCEFDVTITADPSMGGASLTIIGDEVDCGDNTLEICIEANDLIDIGSIEHVLIWDPTILSYNSFTLVNADIATTGASSVFESSDSTLNFGFSIPGMATFDNNEVLYCLSFDIIGDLSNGVTIDQWPVADRPAGFVGPPNQIRDPLFNQVPYTFSSISLSASDMAAPMFTNFPMDRDTFLTANCDAAVSWVAPTVTDDCAVTSTSSTHNPGDVFPLGTTDVIYTAMDAVGNVVMDTFSITVVDTIPPMVQNCPMDTIIEVTAGAASSAYTWTAPTGMDNCPGVMITSTHNPGDTFMTGTTTTVTYTITDASGNEVTCTFDVTVEEELDITCPENVSVAAADGRCDAIVNDINISINDLDEVQSIAWATTGATMTNGTGDASGTTFDVGITTLTYTITDNDNNMMSCSFDIVVVDNQMPSLTCTNGVTLQIPQTQSTTVVIDINALITDNCTVVDTTYSLTGATTGMGSGFASGLEFNVGTTTVTYTVSDGINTADCSFDVVVEQVPLAVECPDNVMVSASSTDCTAIVNSINVNVTAGTAMSTNWIATGATNTSGTGDASGTTFNLGTTTVTYTITDEFNNMVSCSFDVVVGDDEMPSLQCSNGVTVQIPQTQTSTVVTGLNAIITDNCGIVDTTYTLTGATTGTGNGLASGLAFNAGTTTVTYTVSDGTNTAECSFDVVVEQVALMLECPADVTVSTSTTDCTAVVDNIDINVTAGTIATVTYTSTGATSLNGNGDASLQTFNVGTTTVTYLVGDDFGNTETCSFNVTVEDDTPPSLVCRGDTTLIVPIGTSIAVVNDLGIISANDNCTTTSDMMLSYALTGATSGSGAGDASGLVFNVGSTVVTYTLTDENDNSDSCVFNVIVNNPSLEITCPMDTSVIASSATTCSESIDGLFPIILPSLDSAMTVTYSASGATVTTSDTMGINDISGTAFNTGVTNVTYTVVSNMGDVAACNFSVTVLDTFPPSFSCPADITVFSTNADTTAVVTGIDLQDLNDCDPTTGVSYTLSGATNATGVGDASGQTFQADTTEVTYFVMDNNGNRDSCSFLVVVEPAPITLTCPTDMTVAVNTDDCTAVLSGLAAIVADTTTLGSVTYTGMGATTFSSDTVGINDVSNEAFNMGTTNVVYTVTDTLGNMASCSFDITVQDSSDLFLICPSDVTVFVAMTDTTAVVDGIGLVDYGYDCLPNDNIAVTYIIDGVTDTLDASGTTFDLGGTGVTYFVADELGNVEICSFTVTVAQRSPLDITCPRDTTVSTEVDLCSATVNDIAVGISDIGLVDSITYVLSGTVMDTIATDTLLDFSGTMFPIGTTSISYTISDTLGYEVSCIFDVTVEDNQDPDLMCPADITVLAPEGDTTVIINNIDIASLSDNCNSLSELSISYELTGATTASGNGSASGNRFNVGTTTVTYTVLDAGGNSITCSFDVDVVESGELAIGCPPDMVVSAATTSCARIVDDIAVTILSPDSTIQSIVYGLRGATVMDSPTTGFNDASGENFNIGLTTVTYIVTDTLNRIASCSFTIEVEDNSGPRIDCPSDLVVNIPFTDSTAVVNNIGLELLDDNCDFNASATYELTGATEGTGNDDASGTVFNIGTTVVTYTATDTLGNTSSCFFDVEVGQFGVMLECPDNIVVQSDTTACGTVIDSISAMVSPLASVQTLSYELSGATTFQSRQDTILDASGEFFNVGTTRVTYTVNDTLDCSFNVTVQDDLAPIFVNCPDSLFFGMDVDQCFATVRWTVPEILEGCDFVMVPNVAPGTEIELEMMSGDTTITYTATDVNGNTSSCSFFIRVRDDLLPNHIFCPEQQEDFTIMQSDSICGAIVTWNEPQTFDNCGIVSTMQTHEPGDVFPFGTTTVTYTAFDEEGNSGTCSFDVMVVDSFPPRLMNCPMDTTIVVVEPDSTGVATWTPPTIDDSCGDVVLTSNFMPGDTFPMGMTEVIYVANDTISMATDTCSFTITVQVDEFVEVDTIPPAFLDCPDDINVAFDEGQCFATVSWTEPTAIDNGRIDSLFASHMPGDTFIVGTTEILYIAIDSVGLRDTCAFNVVVDGPQNSVLLCPGNVTVIAPLAACGSVVDWTPPTIDRPCSEAPISIVSNFMPGSLFPVGATEVIYIASDTIGYADTCSFTITVLDQELPMFTGCPEDMILSVEPGACEASLDWTVPTVADNCGIAEFVASHEPPFSFPVGETTITYTATDISGNTNNCQFIVTVLDDAAPAFNSCPEIVTVRADGTIISDPSGVITNIGSVDCSSVQLSFTTPTATDVCGSFNVEQTDNTGLSSGSSFLPGTSTLIFTASDESNNTATCEMVIVVEAVETGAVNITVDNPVVCAGGDVELVAEDIGIPGTTYEWMMPGNAPPFSGATLSIFSITADQAGTYTVTATAPTGCTFTNSTVIDVQVAPMVSAGHNDQDILCGAGADLMLTAATLDEITSWSWAGPNNFSSDMQNPVIPNASATDSGNYTVTATTAAGCSNTAMTTVTVREQPTMPTLMLTGGSGVNGTTAIGCSADTFNLVGLEYTDANVQYVWSVTPNNFGFDPGNTNITQVILTEAGDYIFDYSVLIDGCPSDTVSMSVNIEAEPSIQTSIAGETSCVNEGSSIELQAVGEGVTNWEWFSPGGMLLANMENVTLSGLNEGMSGTYRVVGTTANGCTAEATLEVVLSGQLAMPTVGDLGNICDGEELLVSLGGNYPEGIEFQWQSDSSALNFATTDTTFDASDLAPGTYSAMVTASGNGCVSDTTSLSFTILARPMIDFSSLQPTYDCISMDTTVQLMETGIAGSKWFWSSTSGFTSPDQNPSYTISYADSTRRDTIFLQLTGENGCVSMDSTILEFNPGVPQPTIVGAARYCMGETVSLRLSDALPDSTTYVWTGPNGFTSSESMISIENGGTSQAGIYQVMATLGECVSAPSDSFTVTIITPPNVEMDEYTVFVGQTDTLDITTNDELIDNLTLSLGLTNPITFGDVSLQGGIVTYTAPNTVGSGDFSYEICYDVCDDPNLILCDEAFVTVNVQYPPEECVITTLVTPNNDGNNDNLIVTCAEGGVYPDHELIIFNQWGDEVYRAAPYNNDWSGEYNGGQLPDGTYFYIFIPTPGEPDQVQKGFITLYR